MTSHESCKPTWPLRRGPHIPSPTMLRPSALVSSNVIHVIMLQISISTALSLVFAEQLWIQASAFFFGIPFIYISCKFSSPQPKCPLRVTGTVGIVHLVPCQLPLIHTAAFVIVNATHRQPKRPRIERRPVRKLPRWRFHL